VIIGKSNGAEEEMNKRRQKRTRDPKHRFLIANTRFEDSSTPRAANLSVDEHARHTKREPENSRQDAHQPEGGAAFVAVLEANHLGVIRRQQGGDALLGHRVDIVVHCHARDGGARLWDANKGCAMDGGHGSCLGLLRRRRRRQRVLDILWVV